jgi:hypothetical protein
MSHSDQTSLMDCVNGGVIIIVAIIIARQLVVIRAIINQSFCIPWILHFFFYPFFFAFSVGLPTGSERVRFAR